MLEYVVQIYKTQLRRIKKRGSTSEPGFQPVLPVVFYTGTRPWPPLGSFADLVAERR